MSDYKTTLHESEIESNFAPIDPLMTGAEVLLEANRCIYCFDAPCTKACPTHIDVPGFIKRIASGNLKGAARVILDANPIGGSCAKVCPVEVLCEGACVEKTLVAKPIEIARLQRYATRHGGSKELFAVKPSNGKTVAVIGSGPAGLSCAAYLARNGCSVTVFEKHSVPGGLNSHGMAEYKLTRAQSIEEVEMIAALGVEFRVNTRIVGSEEEESEGNVSFERIRDEFDAVFIAIGLGATRNLSIPGEDLEGVYEALDFIERIKNRNWSEIPLGRTIAVVGAGNTAVDVVTQAKRLGAERVMMVYRRTRNDMSAFDYEYELAKSDAVEFVWDATPVAVTGNGRVEKLLCRHSKSNEEFEISCDMLIKAIGQERRDGFLNSIGVATDDRGHVAVDNELRTSLEGVFAGGDCVNGGSEAVDAAQAGKKAASAIHKSLFGEELELAGL
ncbi:MAG: NAD(P)-dependent oxidoreductase [Pyrinomonadaceae bacterium]